MNSDIEKQFNLIADQYDANRRNFIRCFDDFYGLATDLIATNCKAPKRVLDLGAGTGLLDQAWILRFPEARYTLVDIADDMMDIARERFSEHEGFTFVCADYSKELPVGDFDAVISGLSIHHLDDEAKLALFERIYNILPEHGIFANYDQFDAASSLFTQWFDDYFTQEVQNSALSDKEIERWESRRQLDKECSVEEEIEMLQSVGFSVVDCVYSYHKFGVIVAIK